METVEDLGKAVKEQHSQYRHLSDVEAGRKAKRDYPSNYDEYEDVNDTSMDGSNNSYPSSYRDLRVSIPLIQQLDDQTLENIDFLRSQLKPKNGWFATWRAEVHTKRNVRLINALTESQIAVINHGELLERAARNRQTELVNFNLFLRQNEAVLLEIKAKEFLLQDAVNMRMSPEAASECRTEEFKTDLKIKEMTAETELAIRKWKETDGSIKPIDKERESQIEINKHREKTQIDLNNEITRAQEELRLEIIAKHLGSQQQIAFIQELIKEQYIQIDDVRNSSIIPVGAKPDIIASHERIIAMFMIQQDEAQKAALRS